MDVHKPSWLKGEHFITNGLDLRSRVVLQEVRITRSHLVVTLSDKGVIAMDLTFYPRLLNASQIQHEKWELIGAGLGIRWPELDEEISGKGLLSQIDLARQCYMLAVWSPRLFNSAKDSASWESVV
jgi:Protein of unknown function (DUF2442)